MEVGKAGGPDLQVITSLPARALVLELLSPFRYLHNCCEPKRASVGLNC